MLQVQLFLFSPLMLKYQTSRYFHIMTIFFYVYQPSAKYICQVNVDTFPRLTEKRILFAVKFWITNTQNMQNFSTIFLTTASISNRLWGEA